MKRNEEAIQAFEKVFALEPIYKEFECVDCFFLGLINLYDHEKDYEKINPAIERWLLMQQDVKSVWDLCFHMIGRYHVFLT